jgi:hypothetical protein
LTWNPANKNAQAAGYKNGKLGGRPADPRIKTIMAERGFAALALSRNRRDSSDRCTKWKGKSWNQ